MLEKVGRGKIIDTFVSDVQTDLEERSDMLGMSTSEKFLTQVVAPRQKTDASLRSAPWKLNNFFSQNGPFKGLYHTPDESVHSLSTLT
jgi:hypothetical protein